MSELEKRVMERIESEKIAPRPFYVFLAKRAVFWVLAGLSFAIGAMCFALAIFVTSDFYYTGGKAFDEMPFDELTSGLPFVWLLSSLLLAVSATFSIGQTSRGYRVKRSYVLTAVSTASIAMGVLLYGFDVGGKVHQSLSSHFPSYRAATHIPYAEWSRPQAGFLGGKVQSVTGGKALTLLAFDNMIWTVDISTATIDVGQPLIDEGDIAVEGVRTGLRQFRAVRVIPFD